MRSERMEAAVGAVARFHGAVLALASTEAPALAFLLVFAMRNVSFPAAAGGTSSR